MANHSRDLRWRLLRIWRHLNPRAGKTQAQLQPVRTQEVSNGRQDARQVLTASRDTGEVVFLKSITSEPFDVVQQKQWRGLVESTHLSRTFSDQGVRLRLRKENRNVAGYDNSG